MVDEELKQEDKKEGKEEKKSLIKKIILGVIIFLLLSGIIFLILFGVSKCSKSSNASSSSSSEPTYTERYSTANLDNVFKKIMKAALDDNGVTDEVNRINTVSYIDNRTTNSTFDLCITALGNDNHFYYLSITNALYKQDNKELIPYLLDLSSYFIDGDIDLKPYEVLNETINTSKANNKYAVVKSSSDNKYLSGYYFEDNTYHVCSRKELLDNSDPFINSDISVNQDSLLFDYYHFLLNHR